MIDLKDFDPTDSNAAAEAAERANDLETMLKDLLDALDNSAMLNETRSYRGAALNDARWSREQLPGILRRARELIVK